MAIDLLAAKAALERAGGDSNMGWVICGPGDESEIGPAARALGFHVQVRTDCPVGQAYLTDRPYD